MKIFHLLGASSLLLLAACTGSPGGSSSSTESKPASIASSRSIEPASSLRSSSSQAPSSRSSAMPLSSASKSSSSAPKSSSSSLASSSSSAKSSSLASSSSANNGPIVGAGNTPFERGRDLYFKNMGAAGSCASCHGDNGQGVAGKGGPVKGSSCKTCGTPSALVSKIDVSMPAGGASLCTGVCATEIATYIYEAFNGGVFNLDCNGGITKASPMRRLNKTELTHSINDVFGLGGTEMAKALPEEQEVIGGFATVGSALTTSVDWSHALLNGAVAAADVIVDAGNFPKCTTSGSSSSVSLLPTQPTLPECTTTASCQQKYSGATDCKNTEGGVCYCGTSACWQKASPAPTPAPTTNCFASETRRIGKLLFRRALTDAEFTRLDNLNKAVAAKTGVAGEGHKAVLIALISSPKSVFSLASGPKTTARALTGRELADRMALALWGSTPDMTLIDLANSNRLTGAAIDEQLDRMVADPRFDRFAEVFGKAWIGLEGYNLEGSDLGITNAAWTTLLNDMKTETYTFIRHIIKNNLPINELFTARYSFLNGRLQQHYGLPVTNSNTQFTRVNFPAGSPRRGLMTQAAVLAKAFDGTKTSVVKRGVLPLEAFTCTAPHAPTDDAIAEAVNNQANSTQTEKQKMASRASITSCAGCHSTIDPIGWVFTEFGPAGQSVSLDPDGDALTTSGTLFGQNFADASGMVDVLVSQDKFSSCFASKFLTHAIGRPVSYGDDNEDRCAINASVQATQVNSSIKARDFIKNLLKSDIATTMGALEYTGQAE
jgi:cytochrome c553